MKSFFLCLALVVVMSVCAPPARASLIVHKSSALGLSNGLVGHWTFDGKDISGVQAYDRSGNGNRGTLTNGPTRTIGKIGQGMEFDGVDDYVSIDDSTSLRSPTSAITMTAWAQLTKADTGVDVVDWAWIMGKAANAISSGGGTFVRHANNTLGQMQACIIVNTTVTCTDESNDITLHTWHFYAMTWSSGGKVTLDIYDIGGTVFQRVQSTSVVSGSLAYNSEPFVIGNNEVLTDQWLGLIDDVRIYNRALSADEIKRLYKIGATAKINTTISNDSLTKGLVGHWTFDGKHMSGVQAYDASGNGNRGTLTNGPVPGIGKIGQGLSFDGVDDYVDIPHNSVLNPSGELTISVWFNASLIDEDTNAGDMLVSKGDWNSTNSYSLALYGNATPSNDKLWCNIGNEILFLGDSLGYALSNFSEQQWYHVVCMADSAGHRIYVNGSLVASNTTAPASVTNSSTLRIGMLSAFSCCNSNFTGAIDDVRIYNRALSADEIKRLYNLGR